MKKRIYALKRGKTGGKKQSLTGGKDKKRKAPKKIRKIICLQKIAFNVAKILVFWG